MLNEGVAGKDVGAIKAYIDGKGELVQAEAGAASLVQSTKKIAEVFPPGTGGPDSDGKYATKPTIWTDWNKFLDAQKTAAGAGPDVVRLSIGLEDVEDLIADLDQALRKI